jgi:hypothetical protein
MSAGLGHEGAQRLHGKGACVRARGRSCPNVAEAQVILASTDSSFKSGIMRTLKVRIDRIVHYYSAYDAVMRRHHKEARTRRKSTYAKIMTTVTLRATGGTIRGLVAFRRLERKGSGQVSSVATVSEAGGERAGIVWEHVTGDLDLYITQKGTASLSLREPPALRKVLEAKIRNYEQGEPSKKVRVTPAGRKLTVNIIDTKHTASEGYPACPPQPLVPPHARAPGPGPYKPGHAPPFPLAACPRTSVPSRLVNTPLLHRPACSCTSIPLPPAQSLAPGPHEYPRASARPARPFPLAFRSPQG